MESNSETTKFITQVAQMREYQRNYFRYRDPISLQEAKKAERLVDAEIERFTGVSKTSENKVKHPKLF